MIEVEIRTVVKDANKIEKKLTQKFPLIEQKNQTDDYFSHPSRDFYANSSLREYVRIRQEKGKQTFEYHRAHIKNGDNTHTDEFEVAIDNPQKMKQILAELGFKPLVTVNKKRIAFDCKEFEADLDQIQGLGNFLEIEAKKDFGGVKKTRQACLEFLKTLEIPFEIAPKKGYPDMILEKLAKK